MRNTSISGINIERPNEKANKFATDPCTLSLIRKDIMLPRKGMEKMRGHHPKSRSAAHDEEHSIQFKTKLSHWLLRLGILHISSGH